MSYQILKTNIKRNIYQSVRRIKILFFLPFPGIVSIVSSAKRPQRSCAAKDSTKTASKSTCGMCHQSVCRAGKTAAMFLCCIHVTYTRSVVFFATVVWLVTVERRCVTAHITAVITKATQMGLCGPIKCINLRDTMQAM